MTLYQQIKSELKAKHYSTKYFSKDFLEKYIKMQNIIKSMNYEEYQQYEYRNNKNILTSHLWDEITNSKFYKHNNCCYCAFLELSKSHNDFI